MKTRFTYFSSFIVSLVIISQAYSSVHAEQELYTWVDETGSTHFSNSKSNPASKPASLPKVSRKSTQASIGDYNSVIKKTCIQKGGVNCQAGADSDGSVICGDASRDSQEKFAELCQEVKLSSEVIIPKNSKKDDSLPIHVRVRNLSAIPASNVHVSLGIPQQLPRLKTTLRKQLKLEGALDIPAYGIEEYTYIGKSLTLKTLKRSLVNTDCNECWDPLKGQKPPKIIR